MAKLIDLILGFDETRLKLTKKSILNIWEKFSIQSAGIEDDVITAVNEKAQSILSGNRDDKELMRKIQDKDNPMQVIRAWDRIKDKTVLKDVVAETLVNEKVINKLWNNASDEFTTGVDAMSRATLDYYRKVYSSLGIKVTDKDIASVGVKVRAQIRNKKFLGKTTAQRITGHKEAQIEQLKKDVDRIAVARDIKQVESIIRQRIANVGADYADGGSFNKQSSRLVAAEHFRTFQTTLINLGVEKGFELFRWTLSSIHPKFNYYEICEQRADRVSKQGKDYDMKGIDPKGVYTAEEINELMPAHPYCKCVPIPVVRPLD